MIESAEQAIAVLQNTHLPEAERVEGAHFLQNLPSAQGIEALVAALGDDDHGVRWAAGSALAHLGDIAMPALLDALASPENDKRLRDGAHHVLADNTSLRVRQLAANLLHALKGPQAGIATMEAAIELMPSFR